MKPSDFLLGLFDFFAIVLPGAILAYLFLIPAWPQEIVDAVQRPLTESGAKWAAFAVASYTLGHLLHHASSVLDDLWYDARYRKYKLRKEEEKVQGVEAKTKEFTNATEAVSAAEWLHCTEAGRDQKVADAKERLKKAKKDLEDAQSAAEKAPPTALHKKAMQLVHAERISVPAVARLAPSEPPAHTDAESEEKTLRDRPGLLTRLLDAVQPPTAPADTESGFRPPAATDGMFGWIRAAIQLRNPVAAAQLELAGVDSKFFRSLVLVSAVAAVELPVLLLWPLSLTGDLHPNWLPALAAFLASAGLCGLSLWRYGKRRWASTEEAYRYFILLSIPQASQSAKTP